MLDNGELCDDGNHVETDGCRSCVPDGPLCETHGGLACGDALIGRSDTPGTSQLLDAYPCDPAASYTGHEFIYAFSIVGHATVTVALTTTSPDLGLLVLDGNGTATCAAASTCR